VAALIGRKTKNLLSDCGGEARRVLAGVRDRARLLAGHAADTPEVPAGSVSLVVTSPPFLDIVDYPADNWLRCWFIGVDAASVRMTVTRKLEDWQDEMTLVFREVHRVLRPGGHVAFEVGELRKGRIKLEQAALVCGLAAGLAPLLVIINHQEFTKTANCWGVDNNAAGTNTNRIVLFRKDV